MDTKGFTLGSVLEHPIHGIGHVSFIGDDYLGITFDDQNEVLIRHEELQKALSGPAKSNENDIIVVKHVHWPYSTFVSEEDNSVHFMGAHWEPFVDEAREIVAKLPDIIPKALPQTGIGDLRKAPRAYPTDWQHGFQLVWPIREQGLAMILQTQAEGSNLVSLFPFFSLGSQQTVILNAVTVWDGGLEAQITADWGDSIITFFDSQFVINRAWYDSGSCYDFILTGIAYEAKPAEKMEMTVNRHLDEVAWMNQRLQEGEPAHEATWTINLEGSLLLMPIPEWDVDDYSFRAPIKSVIEFSDWLGQDGWRVRATVMRFDDKDADLDIVITRRIWASSEPPKEGQDIEGNLWLQGYLWSVNIGQTA